MTVEYLKVLPAMAEEMQHPNGAAALSKNKAAQQLQKLPKAGYSEAIDELGDRRPKN